MARDSQNVQVEVHHGYKLEKSNELFVKYVKNYSDIKIKAEQEGNNAIPPPRDRGRIVAKLMLNSLYGRFGLKYEPHTIKFVNSKEFAKLSLEHEIIDNLMIDEEKDIEYVKYTTR